MEISHPTNYAKYKNQILNGLAYHDYVGLSLKPLIFANIRLTIINPATKKAHLLSI